MNKRYKLFLGILLLVLLCGCGGDGGELPAGTSPETEPAGEPQETPAPEDSSSEGESESIYITFEGTDLEGNTVSQDAFSQSKLTMVNVWATYCNPCLNEMPDLGELAAAYALEDVQIIGIVSDVLEGEDQELAESLVEETQANYPHLLLNESIFYGLLTDVAAVPTTFFIDGEGVVLDTVVGARDKSAWEEMIHGFLEAD